MKVKTLTYIQAELQPIKLTPSEKKELEEVLRTI